MFRPNPLPNCPPAAICCLAVAVAQSAPDPQLPLPPAPPDALKAAAVSAIDAAQTEAIHHSLPFCPMGQLEAILEASSSLGADTLTLAVSEEILRRQPCQADAIREKLGVHLRRKQGPEATEAAGRLTALDPRNPDAWAAAADALDLTADHDRTAARRRADALEREKALRGSGFNRHSEIADAWEKSGHWERARDAWLTVATASGTTGTEAREAWERIYEIEDTRLPVTAISVRWLREDEGTLFTAVATEEITVRDSLRFGLSAASSWLARCSTSSGWGQHGDDDRQDYGGGFSGPFADGGRWALSAGIAHGSGDRGFASGEFAWSFASGASLSLSGTWNGRADDSLPLVWLDGRQHRASVRAEMPLGEHWRFEAEGFRRQVTLDGSALGRGGGFDAALEADLWKADADRLSLAYECEWRTFAFGNSTPSEGIAEVDRQSLILEEANRHRGVLRYRHEHGPLSIGAEVSGGYRFECGDREFGGGGSLRWRLSDRSQLGVSYAWDSASRTTHASGQSHTVATTIHISL